MAHLARQKKNALYLSLESELFRAIVEKRGLLKCHQDHPVSSKMDSFLIEVLQFSFSFFINNKLYNRRKWQNSTKPSKVLSAKRDC
jgi:hypothetical protein